MRTAITALFCAALCITPHAVAYEYVGQNESALGTSRHALILDFVVEERLKFNYFNENPGYPSVMLFLGTVVRDEPKTPTFFGMIRTCTVNLEFTKLRRNPVPRLYRPNDPAPVYVYEEKLFLTLRAFRDLIDRKTCTLMPLHSNTDGR